MKTKFIILAAACCLPAITHAEDKDNKRPEMRKAILEKFDKDGDGKLNDEEKKAARTAMAERKKRAGHDRKAPAIRQAILEKFDKDGDGKLNEEEKTALKAAMAERKAATIKKYDTDGNGELSKEEKEAGIKAFKEEMIKKYDSDGDGELSKEEREDARKAGEKPPFFGMDHRGPKKRGGDRPARKDKK